MSAGERQRAHGRCCSHEDSCSQACSFCIQQGQEPGRRYAPSGLWCRCAASTVHTDRVGMAPTTAIGLARACECPQSLAWPRLQIMTQHPCTLPTGSLHSCTSCLLRDHMHAILTRNVHVIYSNEGRQPCRFLPYTLNWAGPSAEWQHICKHGDDCLHASICEHTGQQQARTQAQGISR